MQQDDGNISRAYCPVGFDASAVQVLTYQNKTLGLLNKKAFGTKSYIMAFDLFWDIKTDEMGLP